jgi:hypothetical protein
LTTYNSLNQFLGFDVSMVPTANDGRNDIATGFWGISVGPVDAATSSELTVDMYPTSYGALLPAGPMAI